MNVVTGLSSTSNFWACPAVGEFIFSQNLPQKASKFVSIRSFPKMKTITRFSHVRPDDTPYRGEGLRSFFEYRDLGIANATSGKVIAHLVRAKNPPAEGTGWHIHEADFQIVLMLKGWAKFMYEDKETLVSTGDCVHQAPGIRHFLFDYSEDMEYLEIVSPADFTSISVNGPRPVPIPNSWPRNAVGPG
jgi:mannose-6-phosphate isomerase-like protein (cupin superfamily)